MRCLLSPEWNKCEFFDGENKLCTNPDGKCGMQLPGDEPIVRTGYVRQPRWYEELPNRKRRNDR